MLLLGVGTCRFPAWGCWVAPERSACWFLGARSCPGRLLSAATAPLPSTSSPVFVSSLLEAVCVHGIWLKLIGVFNAYGQLRSQQAQCKIRSSVSESADEEPEDDESDMKFVQAQPSTALYAQQSASQSIFRRRKKVQAWNTRGVHLVTTFKGSLDVEGSHISYAGLS